MPLVTALIDAGPLVAYYSKGDKRHTIARDFFEKFQGSLITSEAVVTEVMWLLGGDWRVQNEFLCDLRKGLYEVLSLTAVDFESIAALNEKYKDLPGDFADLSIVVLSKRLNVLALVSIDGDFDIYRSYGKKPFKQLFPKDI